MRITAFTISLVVFFLAPELEAAERSAFANTTTSATTAYWVSISPLLGYSSVGGASYLTDYLNSSQPNNISASISLRALEHSGMVVGLNAARTARVGWDNFPNDIIEQFDEATVRLGFGKVNKRSGWVVEGGAGIGQWSRSGPDSYVRGDVGVLVLHTKGQWALPVEAQYFVRGFGRYGVGLSVYATYTIDRPVFGSRVNLMFGRFD